MPRGPPCRSIRAALRQPYRSGPPGGRSGPPNYNPYRAQRDERGRMGSPPPGPPPYKRMRPDSWNDRGNYNSNYFGGPSYAQAGWGSSSEQQSSNEPVDYPTQPPMMTFKQFLASQEDTIDDSEAVKKYNDYKIEFKRKQFSEFFLAHKDEDWFRCKYHPNECTQRKETAFKALKSRLNTFVFLLSDSWIDNVHLDVENGEAILRLLDAAVIKMEGGSSNDLRILDEGETSFYTRLEEMKNEASLKTEIKVAESKVEAEQEVKGEGDTKEEIVKKAEESTEKQEESAIKVEDSVKKEDIKKEAEEGGIDKVHDDADSDGKEEAGVESMDTSDVVKEEAKNGIDSHEDTKEGHEDSKEGREDTKEDREDAKEDHEDTKEDLEDTKEDGEGIKEGDESEDKADNEDGAFVEESEKEGKEGDGTESSDKVIDTKPENASNEATGLANGSLSEEELKDTEEAVETSADKDVKSAEEGGDQVKQPPAVEGESKSQAVDTKPSEDKPQVVSEPQSLHPRPLHKTVSIFLRNLAPNIPRSEVEDVCKRFPGFIRLALADPTAEKKFYRRGWATYAKHVNIKEICWNLSNMRVRDCELSPIVNRELSRRIRSINGIAAHKTVVRNDIKVAAKIIQLLDKQSNVWEEADQHAEEGQKQDPADFFNMVSKNPLLKNITDYLVEEASAEEEELLGGAVDDDDGEVKDKGDGEVSLERDEKLISVLDRLILYLRIVHSLDYYNASEYPNEDEMPNRCGLIHVRGIYSPGSNVDADVHEWLDKFNAKIQPFLSMKATVSADEAKQLGVKETEAEIEKFIQSNTQELAKDKWLCPLSGKKFKGPEFVRKHILNKHEDRLEEVKKEFESN